MGRVKIHENSTARVAAWRQKQRLKKCRLDGFVNYEASWRLKALADVWGCSRSSVVERLILEADEKYGDLLFPEGKKSEL